MNRIVIGVNDSDEALDALRLGRELAAEKGAEVTVVSVFALDLIAAPVQYEEARAAYVEAMSDRAERELGETGYRHLAPIAEAPAGALQHIAEDEDADLIVIGSTHRGPLGRVVPGSVGERLLHGAPCAVAVAPRGYARGEHHGLGLIGVAYDGFPESEMALDEAIGIATDRDAELRVITVAPAWTGMNERLGAVRAIRDHFRDVLSRAAAKASDGIEVDTVLEEGEAAAALANRGVELDLLVLGSRAYGPLRHVLLGSTSAEVMRTAPCPVVVVPRGAELRAPESGAAQQAASA